MNLACTLHELLAERIPEGAIRVIVNDTTLGCKEDISEEKCKSCGDAY